MPVDGQKLSQTGQINTVPDGYFLPVFDPNVLNARIRFINLITQIKQLVDAYTKSETDLLLDTKANDSDVLHKSGVESVLDEKQFQVFPTLPTTDPSQDFQAVHKKYVDFLHEELATAINNLNLLVANRWIVPVDIDCGANPNYPGADVGRSLRVSVSGRIGGASGPKVEEGDIVLCLETNTGGSHALVGAFFTILQGNIDKATTTEAGTIKLSTNPTILDGMANDEAVTPSTLEYKINQQLLRKTALKTLRFYFGSSPPPSLPAAYVQVPTMPVLSHASLQGVTIYGMCFLDNSPFDNILENPHNASTGQLDLTSFADPTTGQLYEGQKLTLTVIKL